MIKPDHGDSFTGTTIVHPGINILAEDLRPTQLGLELPISEGIGMPGAVTLTGQGPLAGVEVTITDINWTPISALGAFVTQIDVPQGDYAITIQTAKGPINGTATVSKYGGSVVLGSK